MAQALDIVNQARKELGTKESPPNSNNVKYNTAYYGREVHDTANVQYPWCVVFLWWLFQQAGCPELFYGGGKTASCTTLMTYAQKHGQWVTQDYQIGDIVIMNFPNNKTPIDHCGLVITKLTTGLRTIEGNTSQGNDSNGGEVMERTRSLSVIVGAYRPRYEEDTDVKRYRYLNEIPEVFRPIIEKLMNADIIQGDGSDTLGNNDVIDLSYDQIRTLVFVYRGGGFDGQLIAKGLDPAVGS